MATQGHTSQDQCLLCKVGGYILENPVIITAIVAALIAFWGVISQRLISRRRATSDLVHKVNNDQAYISATNQFASSKELGELEMLANPGKTTCDEARKIQVILNNYESVSVGIKRGTLDYKIIKDNWRSSIIYHWENGEPFIIKMRNESGQKTLWEEFEKLYHWVKNHKKPPILNRLSNLLF